MPEPEDIDALAGEYVIGTLTAAERATVAARMLREPALADAVSAWERRLAPLNDTVPPVAPPTGLLDAILRQIGIADRGALASTAQVVALEGRMRRWRRIALVASAAAASLVAIVGYQIDQQRRSAPGRSYVAVLQKDQQSPGFLITVDTVTRQLTIRQIAAQHQPNRSLELWIAHASLPGPRSLGLLEDREFSTRPARPDLDRAVLETGLYEVSLEPQGGSPTGAPTGPVLFIGRIVQATP
jgi:anti-sigma-K factor RskA